MGAPAAVTKAGRAPLGTARPGHQVDLGRLFFPNREGKSSHHRGGRANQGQQRFSTNRHLAVDEPFTVLVGDAGPFRPRFRVRVGRRKSLENLCSDRDRRQPESYSTERALSIARKHLLQPKALEDLGFWGQEGWSGHWKTGPTQVHHLLGSALAEEPQV